MSEPMQDIRVEPATLEDLPALTDLLVDLFTQETDFQPDPERQMRGVRLILEQPNRGRIFVLRNMERIFGMVNLLFTISTAEGGVVLVLEDLVVHRDHRGRGYGSRLLQYAIDYAREKECLRITLLTDRADEASIRFFERRGFYVSDMVPMRLILGDGGGGRRV